MGHGHQQARIVPLVAYEHEMGCRIDAALEIAIETVFFAASNTQWFAHEGERNAFRERWLGRYLDHYRQHFFLALGPYERVVGYLAGCLDDPAHQPLFADIGYFPALADLTQLHPAHLHINLDAGWRDGGIGTRLIEAFCAHAAAAAAPGVHVVTGEGARNVRFYARCGFHPLRSFDWNASRLIVLGRTLSHIPSGRP
jgi:GNAT superfamily N-acetyltransferase